jgi:sugar fermentation stimulation protein A
VRFEPPLRVARFLGRRKRFFADLELESGERATAHIANTGSMRGLTTSGVRALVRPSTAKLPFAVEALEVGETFVGVNTLRANQVAREALASGLIPGVDGSEPIQGEVVLAQGSRIDFVVGSGPRARACEVKSVTMAEGGVALFPDAVTTRGRKHLELLSERVLAGGSALALFMILRDDVRHFAPATSIDPAWAAALRAARDVGVKLSAVRCRVDALGITPIETVPVIIPA